MSIYEPQNVPDLGEEYWDIIDDRITELTQTSRKELGLSKAAYIKRIQNIIYEEFYAVKVPLNLKKKTSYIVNEKFNTEQKEAILYNENKNLVVIAGAGSGKTSVFIERLNYLKYMEVGEYEILALTFTEKASFEIKKRTNLDLEYLGTFHSVFFKLLVEKINFTSFDILDTDSYEYYLKHTFNKMEFDTKEFSVKIGDSKDLDRLITEHLDLILEVDDIDEFYELLNNKITDKTNFTDGNIVKKFYEYKIKDKKLSFSDILVHTYFMIKNDREFYQNKFTHILIDEFQDSNKIVLEILDMISDNNIFYVGDIYQSIYSFQGSSFEKSMEIVNNSEVIQLKTNYRSSDFIVDFANSFIDSKMIEKSNVIKSIKANGLVKNKNISIIENINDFTISELIYKSDDELSDICILARNNNHIKEIKEQLDKWGVPYSRKNKREFEYILDSLLLMLINGYKIDDKYFDRFNIKNSYSCDGILDCLKTIELIVKEINLPAYFFNRGFEDLNKKLERWEEKQLKIFSQNDNIELYLDVIEKNLEYFLSNELYIEKIGVNVMTIHRSKGLEWKTTILYNFEDGVFPNNIFSAEEQRLYYVAVTRAKENLIITSKNNVNSYTNKNADYIDVKVISNQKKYELYFDNDFSDVINFKATCEDLIFNYPENEDDYKKRYKKTNRDIVIEDTLRNYNHLQQSNIINHINDISIEDIENMIYDLKEFKKITKLDNEELKNTILNINLDKKLFFDGDKIHNDYIDNEFTDICHRIFNYKNWINKEEIFNDWFEEREIKRFKRIVLRFVSKKNTDLTKNRAKKYNEKRADNIKVKMKNNKLNSYDDFVDNMMKNYYAKSNEQKQFFIKNVLGMRNIETNLPILDLSDDKYSSFVGSMILDMNINNEGNYVFNKEFLKGKFLNDVKINQAHKRLKKLRYLEEIHKEKRANFLTFTLPSCWHKWKTKHKSLKEERKYADGNILIENKNFILAGNNLEEHFINSAKKIQEISIYFYHTLKANINNYKKKHNIEDDLDVGYLKQIEPHKNLTSHIHLLIFVDERIKHLVQKAFNKTIIEFGLNRKFQDNQTILKTTDMKDIDEETESKLLKELMELGGLLEKESNLKIKKGYKKRIKKINKIFGNNFASVSSYIGKYLMKNAFSNEEDDKLNNETLEFFNAWESMLGNKTKVTGMSNFKHTTQRNLDFMHKWYRENAPETLTAVKKINKPIYLFLEEQQINGNFKFEYERRVKENFNNANFMKDVEFIYLMLKRNELTVEELEEELKLNEFNIDVFSDESLSISFKEILKDRNESDTFLWELATNFILNNQDSSKYINIHTDKKLVKVSVSEKLIYKHSKTNYMKAIKRYDDRLNNAHLSFVPTEWSFKWTSFNRKWSLKDEAKFNIPKKNNVIYFENMYINGFMSENDIVNSQEFDKQSFIDNEIEKIKHYNNSAYNIDFKAKMSLKEDKPIEFLMSA